MNMAEINVNHINPFLMAAGTILRDACQMENHMLKQLNLERIQL